MNNLDKTYTSLLQDILDNGVEKKDRTGTGTLSVFGRQIRHKMSEGFPLLTTKKMSWKSIVTELLWFLRGDTNIKFLVDNDCHIWDGDCFANYKRKINLQNNWEITLRVGGVDTIGQQELLSQDEFINKIKTDGEFAKTWGDLGPIYGKQWRSWGTVDVDWGKNGITGYRKVDQIANLINDLKTNPDSRRLMVNAWNVGELDQMVLPPCHYGFQVYTRELSLDERRKLWDKKVEPNESAIEYLEGLSIADMHDIFDQDDVKSRAISLMWNQRSVDTFLGLPFNIASYGLLLEIIAKEVNMVPDELIGNLGDVHLYSNHIEQAKEQIGQPIFEESPTLYPNGPMNEGIKKQIVVGHTREPYPLPTLNIFEPAIGKKISILDNLHIWSPNCFIIENYQSHPTIKAPLSN
jgi:thymidylate synthase